MVIKTSLRDIAPYVTKDGSRIRELMHPFEQMASLCHMRYLPPFTLFSARNAYEENRIDDHVDSW